MTTTSDLQDPQQRLLSLDFMRGFIMVLLASEAAGSYGLIDYTDGILHGFFMQFHHHPWNGLRFWDLIQPGFMFIAGTAMAFSLNKQYAMGRSWEDSFKKALKRSGWLFFWGVLDYAVRGDRLSFELWDVLTQLSFTMLVAFLVFRWSYTQQILVCAGLLLLTEGLYRLTSIPGFDQPFTDQHNFGNWIDLILMNKINRGGWVAINCIPTAVHTIGGAMAGKWFLNNKDQIKPVIIWGAICLVVGFAQDWIGITPIIKRIATTSFTLASLGWCMLGLAFCYWWIDMKGHRKHLRFFTIVGMNSIFIYLFFEIVGSRWLREYIRVITDNITGWIGLPEVLQLIIGSACVFGVYWYLCYWLYQKKIFFKL
ncbi:MAG: acyltransferase family protein [Bacteroidota bacterium]